MLITQFCIILFNENSVANCGSATAGAEEIKATKNDAIEGKVLLIKKGKKNYFLGLMQ